MSSWVEQLLVVDVHLVHVLQLLQQLLGEEVLEGASSIRSRRDVGVELFVVP